MLHLFSALHAAAMAGHASTVRLLLQVSEMLVSEDTNQMHQVKTIEILITGAFLHREDRLTCAVPISHLSTARRSTARTC